MRASIKDIVAKKTEDRKEETTTRNTMPTGGGLTLDSSATRTSTVEAPVSTSNKEPKKNMRDFYSGLMNKNAKKKAEKKKEEEN